MHTQKWLIAYGKYEGLEKRAIELLTAHMQPYLKHVIVVKAAEKLTEEDKTGNSIALVGTAQSNPILRGLILEGKIEKDFYGNILSPFKVLEKGATASAEEVERNPRARSAKLRVAEKL